MLIRLCTVCTSCWVSFLSSFFIRLDSSRSGTCPSPLPVLMTWIGTFWITGPIRRRSLATSLSTRPAGPSVTRTTPGRPMARKMRSRVRGSMAAGWSSTIQPRRSADSAAPAAPGWSSIRANAARSARRDR